MKIAISAASDNIEAQVNPTFGRCQGFIIAEIEGSEIKNHNFIFILFFYFNILLFKIC